MFLASLTWLQFVAVFGGISAGVVALYLWDRSKRRVRVATLRFFTAAERIAAVRRRRRIQQPLSLALQLIGIALMLLALAQLRLGAPGPAARDHVVILDTSAWMAARSGRGTLMDEARLAAWAYVRALPASDRVMLVRGDALATPATAFERNRAVLEQALVDSHPGSTALNLSQAIEFARQAQRLQAGRSGEIVYSGAGRVLDRPSELASLPAAGVRVLPVNDALENCGLRRIGLRRSTRDPGSWQVLVGVRNYGARPRTVSLVLSLDGAAAGARRLTLEPGAEENASFECRTRSAGRLEARLSPGDAFGGDDRAVLDLPAEKPLAVLVYSEEPEQLRPLLSNPLVNAEYRRPADYRANAPADIVILDRFSPAAPPAAETIWIEPPGKGGPATVRTRVNKVPLTSWHSDHPISAGLKAKDLKLDEAEVFAPEPGQEAVAEVEAGPVIVARAERPRWVALGFHPVRGALRYELTTPLLFANILRWMAPDIFRHWELNAGSAGNVTVPLGGAVDAGQVRVVTANGAELPYALEGNEVRFFAAAPGTVRVIAGDREIVYSLILPQMGETRWTPGRDVRRGVPPPAAGAAYIELWPWLAAAGALILMVEWMLFGRSGQAAVAARGVA